MELVFVSCDDRESVRIHWISFFFEIYNAVIASIENVLCDIRLRCDQIIVILQQVHAGGAKFTYWLVVVDCHSPDLD